MDKTNLEYYSNKESVDFISKLIIKDEIDLKRKQLKRKLVISAFSLGYFITTSFSLFLLF